MLVVKDLSKSFDEKQILNKVSFSLENKEVVGLIGENGSGKTTILKILMGEEAFDGGKVERGSEVLAYLPQHPEFKKLTVNEFLKSKLINKENDFEVEAALAKVGLLGINKNVDVTGINKQQSCESLSSGQKTKLYLASLLLLKPAPTVLLLDEPTNNLDLKGIEWATSFIKSFKGSVLVVSHDRRLLDDVVDRILSLKDGSLKQYGGNYSFYRQEVLKEQELAQERYEKSVKEVKKVERLIREKEERVRELEGRKMRDNDKFAHTFLIERATKKTVHGKGSLEARLERTERLEKPKDRKDYGLGFVGETHSDKLILKAKNVSKTYSYHKGGSVSSGSRGVVVSTGSNDGAVGNGSFKKQVLKNVSFEVRGKEHVWIKGGNGSGKTTLLKIISGSLFSDFGELEWGSKVKFGIYPGVTDLMSTVDTGIAQLKSTGTAETQCYTFASYLHLWKEDLAKRVSSLSRGQVAKLEFVKLLLSNNNLLILDEPTNHLEIETREEIEDALKDYKGAIIVASHDRYFLEAIGVDKVVDLD